MAGALIPLVVVVMWISGVSRDASDALRHSTNLEGRMATAETTLAVRGSRLDAIDERQKGAYARIEALEQSLAVLRTRSDEHGKTLDAIQADVREILKRLPR